MTQGKVSVLMPTRDDAATIDESLRSLAAQTHRQWELLVTDDSADNATQEVVDRFMAEHPGQVRYFRGAGRGQLAALGVVARLADGDFVTLLHSDDVLVDSRAFDRLTRALVLHRADGAYGDLVILDERSHVVGRQRSRLSPGLLLALGGRSTIPDFFFLTCEAFVRHAIPNYVTWNTPYYFSVGEAGLRVPRLLKLEEPWYGYRVHAGQYASSASGLFDKTTGELRTLVTAHRAGLYVHPPAIHGSPRLARLMARFLDVRRSGSSDVPLRQLARAVGRKHAALASCSSDPTLQAYIARASGSVEDLRAHDAGRRPTRPLDLDGAAVRGVPIYSGCDAPRLFRELREGNATPRVSEFFAKEFDAVVARDEEAFAWASTMMRLLAYATPVLRASGASAGFSTALVNSYRPHA